MSKNTNTYRCKCARCPKQLQPGEAFRYLGLWLCGPCLCVTVQEAQR